MMKCASGFRQIPLTIPHHGSKHYEFCNLHIGLKLAMSTFRKIINTGMAWINDIKASIYMDDLIVIRATLEQLSGALVEV
jgi:hypothetical protein